MKDSKDRLGRKEDEKNDRDKSTGEEDEIDEENMERSGKIVKEEAETAN